MPLDAIVCAHDEDCAVQGGERALGLRGEVHVARRVHERDGLPLVLELGLCGEDRDAALALHGVRVEMRAPAVNSSKRAGAARIVEHGLGERGLARVNVRQYAYDHGCPLVSVPARGIVAQFA